MTCSPFCPRRPDNPRKMIWIHVAADPHYQIAHDNFHTRAIGRLEPGELNRRTIGIRGQQLFSKSLPPPIEQLRRCNAHSPCDRRNIRAGCKRFLHKPGLRLFSPLATAPKGTRIKMIDHLIVSIIRQRRAYRNFHHQLQIPKLMNHKSSLLPLHGVALPLTRHTAERVFDRLRDECGFIGGYTIVKDYMRERE